MFYRFGKEADDGQERTKGKRAHRRGSTALPDHNPATRRWVKRDTETGQFKDQKADRKPFKGVRREK